MADTARRVVIDTDIGSDVDDAIALGLALASPELEVRALTVVGRQSLHRARLARRYLELAGRPEIPVHAGRDAPLPLEPEPPPEAEREPPAPRFNWFDHEGEALLPDPRRLDAVDALIDLFSRDEGLELVAIGPLTNVYEALRRRPGIAAHVRRLTVMGGHLRPLRFAGRSFGYGIDYNLCSDARAARAVLRAGIPTRLVTADATLGAWLARAELDALRGSEHPFLRALVRDVEVWTPMQRRLFGYSERDADNEVFLHDPLTVACVHDESFCKVEELHVETLIAGPRELRTVPRPEPVAGITRILRCATAVDRERFARHVVERLRGHFG